MSKKTRYLPKFDYKAIRGSFTGKVGSLSFSGMITIIAVLMVINIYLSLYSAQFLVGEASSFFKDVIYAECALCFIALVSLGTWFRTLRSRLFSLVDAAREMISTEASPKRSGTREDIFSEMGEVERHMRALHDRMTYFATLSGSISAMLDSLGQGFLIIASDGKCSKFYSKACEVLFEISPAGMPVADLLQIPPSEREPFDGWLNMLFEETMAFEDLADLAPKTFDGTKGRHITLELKPVRGKDQKIEGVLLIATDRSREFESELKAKQDREKSEMIIKITQDREMFRILVKKCRELISWLRFMERKGYESDYLSQFTRDVHTVKGSANCFFMTNLVNICHEVETELKDSERKSAGELQTRIKRFTIDFEMELTSILLNYANLLGHGFESDGPQRVISLQTLLEFDGMLNPSLGADIETVREQFFLEFICVPIREVVSSFDGRVQELAQRLGKQIGAPRFSGIDIRVHKELNEDIFFNLVHIFNNIVDHGIEPPEERRKLGKPPIGKITTDVQLRLDDSGVQWVEIRISDDGRGVDPVKVRAKLERLGKLKPTESDFEVIQHIFDTGFSTRDEATDLSGRGVGLNALKASVLAKNGKIWVLPSKPYGATFLIRIPEIQICGKVGEEREKNSVAA